MKHLIIAVILLTNLNAGATTVRTAWSFDTFYQFDYVSGEYIDLTVPNSINVTVDFDNVVTSVTDHGSTTITYLGEYGEAKLNSPLTQYVVDDPNGIGKTGINAYAFPHTVDYESTFIEQFAVQGGDAVFTDRNVVWAYAWSLRVDRRTESRGGLGTEDYAFNPESTLIFLNDIYENPLDYNFSFSERYAIYNTIDNVSYFEGFLWQSYSGTLTSITTIPVPAAAWLFASALIGLASMTRLIGIRRIKFYLT